MYKAHIPRELLNQHECQPSAQICKCMGPNSSTGVVMRYQRTRFSRLYHTTSQCTNAQTYCFAKRSNVPVIPRIQNILAIIYALNILHETPHWEAKGTCFSFLITQLPQEDIGPPNPRQVNSPLSKFVSTLYHPTETVILSWAKFKKI